MISRRGLFGFVAGASASAFTSAPATAATHEVERRGPWTEEEVREEVAARAEAWAPGW